MNMKIAKYKTILYLLLFVTICFISGCSGILLSENMDKNSSNPPQLTERGIQLISKVDTLAETEEYISLYTADTEIIDIIQNLSKQDYTKPETIFLLENGNDILLQQMIPQINLSENILQMIQNKFATLLPTKINTITSTEALVVQSILNYNESFIDLTVSSPSTYLYTYPNGYSFIVNYIPQKEGIVEANISVILHPELSQCSSTDDLIQFFKNTLLLENLNISIVPHGT